VGTNLVDGFEAECEGHAGSGELAVICALSVPFIQPHHAIGCREYERYKPARRLSQRWVWPFICGFLRGACLAAGQMELAECKLLALTELVKPWHENERKWGFNEWIMRKQVSQRSGLARLGRSHVLYAATV